MAAKVNSLDGKIVLITGGGGGMGSSMTLGLIAEGARVAVAELAGTWTIPTCTCIMGRKIRCRPPCASFGPEISS